MNRDLLNNVGVREVATATMGVIDAIQDRPAAARPLAIAAAFLLLSERMNVSVPDLFAMTTNLMNHAEGRRTEFKAVAAYLREELK